MKPLNVRCAEALGCNVKAVPHFGQIRHECGCDDKRHAKAVPIPYDFDSRLHDFGDDTPEGWSCTGPLIPRYKLSLVADADGYFCSDAELEREVKAPTACAAVAEWCAKFAEEKP